MHDVLWLSRLQFAFTISFHYIYPPLSIGLGLILVLIEGLWLKTKNPLYHQLARFWTKVFALTFAMGVATGIVMEFEFGTNWSTYSRFVGDIFGSALAAEGIFAFFLESGFLAVLLFGWDKVGPKLHFFATCMVALGAHFSAIWIIVANSWQQTPAGFHLVGEGLRTRAEVTDFWAMVFNPSSMDRLIHTLGGAWLAGATLVASVGAYYVLRDRHRDFARASVKIGLALGLAVALVQPLTGDHSGKIVARHQPAKLAAFEGHYQTGPAPLYLFGWVDEKTGVTHGIAIPGMLSWLVHDDAAKPITGLNDIAPADRPPVGFVFQTYHAMIAIGIGLIALMALGTFFLVARHAVRPALVFVARGFCRARPAARQPVRLVVGRGGPPALDRVRAAPHTRRSFAGVARRNRADIAPALHVHLPAALRALRLPAQRQDPPRPRRHRPRAHGQARPRGQTGA